MRSGLATRLAKVLAWAAIPAREVDRLAGLTPGHALLIKDGRKVSPSSSTLGALAVVLGFSLDWLVLGRGGEPTPEDVCAAVERARHDPKRTLDEIARVLGVRGKPRSKRVVETPKPPVPLRTAPGPAKARRRRTPASPEARA